MKQTHTSPKPLALALSLSLAAFAAAAVLAHTSQQPPTQTAPEPHALDALDREVQKRFHDVIGFGMARIATERRFEPETKEERAAVRELKRAGYEVGLYLAGRAILDDAPEQTRQAKKTFGSGMTGQAFSGPVFVGPGVKRLPTAAALWDGTRRAMESFAAGAERHEFTTGRWQAEARPVRASEEKCLRCHSTDHRQVYGVTQAGVRFSTYEPKGNTLKVGDPLGVLIYAYRKKG